MDDADIFVEKRFVDELNQIIDQHYDPELEITLNEDVALEKLIRTMRTFGLLYREEIEEMESV